MQLDLTPPPLCILQLDHKPSLDLRGHRDENGIQTTQLSLDDTIRNSEPDSHVKTLADAPMHVARKVVQKAQAIFEEVKRDMDCLLQRAVEEAEIRGDFEEGLE